MKLSPLSSALLLIGALSLTAVAETGTSQQRKPASVAVTPKPKATKSTPAPATPKARSKTTPPRSDATPAPSTPKPEARTEDLPATPAPTRAPAATLAPEELREFAAQPPRVQQLITAALELTKLNLTYTYGSADPAKGGMDCSGTMYHLLRAQGFSDVPRDSSGQYVWARKHGPFFAVVGKTADSFEFYDLQPGDLLFWTGTYEVQRDIPISHVMLYLGTEKQTKKRVMFGASDGRSYAGVQRWGVSVFDFKMPREGNGNGTHVDFVGYGRIPELRTAGEIIASTPPPAEPAATPGPATPAPAKKRSASNKKSGGTSGTKAGTKSTKPSAEPR